MNKKGEECRIEYKNKKGESEWSSKLGYTYFSVFQCLCENKYYALEGGKVR
jgi:hypothetical protein